MRDEFSRNVKRMLAFCAAALLWTTVSISAGPPDSPAVLTVGKIEAKPVAAGDSTVVHLTLNIARGYHVNANPAASEFYIPLEVKLSDTGAIHAGATHYPKGKKWQLAGTDEDLLVYGGAVTVDLPLVIAKDAKPGMRVVQGGVDFQACTNEVCLLPDSLPLSIGIIIQ